MGCTQLNTRGGTEKILDERGAASDSLLSTAAQSPRGDGNNTRAVPNRFNANMSTAAQSPRGDGNQALYMSCMATPILSTAAQSPRGDGNDTLFNFHDGSPLCESTAAQSPRGDGNSKHSLSFLQYLNYVDSSSIPARGRKHHLLRPLNRRLRRQQLNPREGTETGLGVDANRHVWLLRRQQLNPREGTET